LFEHFAKGLTSTEDDNLKAVLTVRLTDALNFTLPQGNPEAPYLPVV
jgi:hypothetical protein